MADHLTQTFKAGTNTHTFWAVQNEHNHEQGIAFTKFAKDLMKRSYPGVDIEQGDWKKKQGKPSGAHLNELKWNVNSKKWEQK
jgi:hypothetical protein